MTQMLMSAHAMEKEICKIETQERFWDSRKLYGDLYTNMTDMMDSIAFAESKGIYGLKMIGLDRAGWSWS